jgi:hypothetical protein
VKERPILFSGPMVRAILEGRKTQTRRVVKSQPTGVVHARLNGEPAAATCCPIEQAEARGCQYGKHGDRLWVKETWRADDYDPKNPKRTIYVADVPADVIRETKGIIKCRPSIFMPRNRSRITLEIVSVRVERLQEITETDAIAEGCQDWELCEGVKMWRSPVEAYGELWDSINGEGAWNVNPWVWVIEFKRVESEVGA